MHRAVITIFAAACLSACIVAPASAAPHKPPVQPSPPPAPPAPTWTGFYVGGLAGGARGTVNASTTTPFVPGDEFNPPTVAAFNAAGAQKSSPLGFIGGFDAGYNWQASPYVFGVEGDIEWLHFRGNVTSGPLSLVPPPGTFTITSSGNIDWLATARGRIGYATGSWLFYATGGAAFTTLHGNFSFAETFTGGSEAASVSDARAGYVVGGGVETFIGQHWSVKAEYLYIDFGSISAFGVDTTFFPPQSFSHTMNFKLNIARAGLNYHF